jgi:hypothetical protein
MERIFFVVAFFVSVPLLTAVSTFIGLEFLAIGMYLVMTRYTAPFWYWIVRYGYVEPSVKTPEEIRLSNIWQLLLFPAWVQEEQRSAAWRMYLRAGLSKWEGRTAAFFCAFAFAGDLLDGFDEDWGLPISKEVVYDQFRLFIFWDFAIALIFNYQAEYFLARVAVGLAVIEMVGLIFLFTMDQVKWKWIALPDINEF